MSTVHGFLAVLLAASLGAAGCSSPSTPAGAGSAKKATKAKKEGKPVAWVGDEVITAEEVAERFAELAPFLQARYRESPERKKEFLNNLIRYELLAQEAYRRGLDQSPEVEAMVKRHLVQEMSRLAVEQGMPEPDEKALREFYDEHLHEFVKPERVRVQHIFIAAGEDAAARAEARKRAEGLLRQLDPNEKKASPKAPGHADYNRNLFADLAREHSDDRASKVAGGDLRYLTRDELTERYGARFSEAAFGLSEEGKLSRVIETEQGFHIARLTNRHPEVNRPFEDRQVQETLKSRIVRERRTKAFDSFVDRLKESSGVRIDEEALAEINPPATPTSPMGIPPAAPRPRSPVEPAPTPNSAAVGTQQ